MTEREELERTVRQRFLYILGTHEPERAIIITALALRLEEDEVQKICEKEFKEAQKRT